MAIGKLLKQNKIVKELVRNKDNEEDDKGGFPSIDSIYDKYPDLIEERYLEIKNTTFVKEKYVS